VQDLSSFESDSFDVVLCLGGVVSHISSESERHKAVSELVRVAKTGALVGVSAIGYLPGRFAFPPEAGITDRQILSGEGRTCLTMLKQPVLESRVC